MSERVRVGGGEMACAGSVRRGGEGKAGEVWFEWFGLVRLGSAGSGWMEVHLSQVPCRGCIIILGEVGQMAMGSWLGGARTGPGVGAAGAAARHGWMAWRALVASPRSVR